MADSLFRALPVGVGLLQDRVFIEVNDTFCCMLGYSRDELIGRSSRMVYPTDEDFEYVGREKYRQIAESGSGQVEARFLRKDGSVIDVLLSSTYVDLSDPSKGVTFTAMDLSGSKKEKDNLQRILASLPSGVMVIDGSENVVHLNDAARRFFGAEISGEIRTAWGDVFGCRNRDIDPEGCGHSKNCASCKMLKYIRDVLRGGEGIEGEDTDIGIEDRSEPRSLIFSVVPMMERGERMALVSFNDITPRMVAERELAISEAKLKRAEQVARMGYWEFDLGSGDVHASEGARKLYGIGEGELSMEQVQNVPLPEYREMLDSALESLVKKGDPYDVEFKIIRPDDACTVHIHSIAEYDADRNVVFGIIRDETERKEMEDDLRKSESLLNNTQKIARIGGWEYDVEKKTMFWTKELYSIHGFEDEDIEPGSTEHIERSITCYDLEDRPVVLSAFERCVSQGEHYDLEFPFTSYKGERLWIRTSGMPIIESGRAVRIIGNLMDITSLKKAREEIIEQRDIASFHLDLLNHDIGNLHQGLYSSMQLLEITEDPEKRLYIIRLSLSILNRSMKLTEDVKLLSHMRDSRVLLEPVDVVPLMRRVSSTVKDMFTEREVSIDVNAPEESFNVMAEPFLEQLFINILHNAVKCQRGRAVVEVFIRREGSKVILDFEDHGPGFPARSIQELLERTKKGVGMRRGLGLVLSAEIANRHNADLEVMPRIEDDPSRGTRFRLIMENAGSDQE